MSGRVIALLHPGAMGVTVGAALLASGQRVRWLSAGRSDATARRAAGAGFEAAGTLAELLDGAHGAISVCPPEAAENLAQAVSASGFRGLFVDANAIAPATVRRLGRHFAGQLVDGGIVGPPAVRAGTTRLYLSGEAAADVAPWFGAGPLQASVIPGSVGAASALKMCYAAYTKGTAALLLGIRALAEAEGVSQPLLAEWAESQPGLAGRSDSAARGAAPKAWRFAGEMREIAATFESAGLPGGFHQAAAEVFERLAAFKDADHVDPLEVIARVADPR